MAGMISEAAIKEAIIAYQRDGAAVLRGVVSPEWIERGGAGIDRLMQLKDAGGDINEPGTPRFFNGLFGWLRDPDLRAIIFESGLAQIAARVMGSDQARFFYDQILVKEPGSKGRTPWHQDLSYWPVQGEQIMSIWIPFDPASPETGVVSYVRGSHRWKDLYRAEKWSHPDSPNAQYESFMADAQPELATLPDISKHPDRYEYVTWTMAPGDVILHHPLAVHGAPANTSQTIRRRALSLRWIGDDVRWNDSHAHFLRAPRMAQAIGLEPQVQGEPLRGTALFPVVWTRPSELAT